MQRIDRYISILVLWVHEALTNVLYYTEVKLCYESAKDKGKGDHLPIQCQPIIM